MAGGTPMVVSSRTPEGEPNRCPVCGNALRLEPSRPPGDAPCPSCGALLWFPATPGEVLPVTVSAFLVAVQKSGVLDATQFDRYVQKLRAGSGLPARPSELAALF